MRRFAWIVTLPIIAIIAVFAVDNRQGVDLELWPLPWALPPVPLFLLVLCAILFGFLIGVAAMWFSGARQRRRLREAKRDLDTARSDLHVTRQQAAAERRSAGSALVVAQNRLPPAA